ncbi:MAG: hypothetical protein VXY04_05975 [Pseudomonadota bacterium]|nr:hypothetical protein [Pseudomonadota bacterium]
MRTWFPFTDYDFYAYLTSGLILVATFDLAFFGGELVYQESWTFVQGVFWTIVCYLIGHVVAGLSSLILQQLAFSGLFLSPEAIVLDLKGPRLHERIFRRLFADEYSRLPEHISRIIREKLAQETGNEISIQTDRETIFQTAFSVSRYEVSSKERLDVFMNLYGLCRNVSFSFLISSAVFTTSALLARDRFDIILAFITGIMAVGMFGRYLKFYSAYTREILRTYGRKS